MIFSIDNPLWQWDKDRKLQINSDLITTTDAINFQQHWTVISATPYMNGNVMYVNIPNQLLKNHIDLEVYAYITDNGVKRTLTREIFPIEERIKPPEYTD